MAELRDSSDAVGVPEELRHRLAEDGYLFLSGVLAEDDLVTIRRRIRAALTTRRWVEENDDSWTLTEQARSRSVDELWPVIHAATRFEELHRLAYHPRLSPIVESLFDEAVFVHPMKIVRVVPPATVHRGPTLTPHQEIRVTFAQDMLVSWLPLLECPRRRGVLAVMPGSHQHGLRPLGSIAAPGGRVGRGEDTQWASSDLVPGDVILFHCLTLHAALPNVTTDFRISAELRWQPVAEPVYEASLAPYGGGSWSDVTRDWSSRRWVEVPANCKSVAAVEDLDAAVLPPSRFSPVG